MNLLYLAESGVRSWLEVTSRVQHPFLLTNRVFGEPEQLLPGAGRIGTVWSRAATHGSSFNKEFNVSNGRDSLAGKGTELEVLS